MLNKLTTYIVAALILIGLSTTIYIQNSTIKSINEDYKTASLNLKAYVDLNSKLVEDSIERNRVFKLTVDQFSQYSDSLLVEMNNYRKKLKAKDKDLQSLQYIASNTRVDTFIKLKDTVLIKGTKIDTTIQDKWFSVDMKLRYPDTLRISPSFKNEIFVAIHTTRETVEPPKKFFIARWFQKRQTIVVADVEDKNPYTTLGTQRFIQITK